MLEKLFTWVEKYSYHKHATKALSLVSFVESSFFPIPPFVLIVGMLAQDKKPSWIRLALIGMVSSVLGGVAGYFIGKFFYGYVGQPLVTFYGLQSEVTYLGSIFREHVFATIFLASISPIPYKVFTLSAGLFSVNIWSFIAASIVGRSLRFFVVAYISDRYGARAKNMMLRQQKTTSRIVWGLVILCVVYVLLKMRGIL